MPAPGRALPRVTRELSFDEKRWALVYQFAAVYEQQWGSGVTRREVGALLGLAHDGTGLVSLLDRMIERGWLTATRDTATRFAPMCYRARGLADTRLWTWHVEHYDGQSGG